ncbi:MAG: hypothetical protein Q4D96_12965 [Propionibacteriaceae bacterium]|nr:hypothetical protein [Propionibacteriaceae bacterium]
MRWSSIWSEAMRNVASGTTRALLGALAMIMILAGTVVQDALAVQHIFASQRAVRSGGGATHVISAPDGIDGERCVGLTGLNGVTGSMALREVPGRFAVLAYPHSKPSLYEVTGDVGGTLGAHPSQPAGVWLSEAMAKRFGTRPLPMADGGTAHVAGVFPYPDDGRNSQLASAALAPVPPMGVFDSCWVTIWPHDPASLALLDTVLVPGVNDATRQQLNPSFGSAIGTLTLLEQRPTRWLLSIGAAAAAALGFVLIRTRRVELSLAQHLGVRATQQRLQLVLETACWALPAGILAAAASVVATTVHTTALEASWLLGHIGMGSGACLAAAILGSQAAALLIVEKKLYLWTKDR